MRSKVIERARLQLWAMWSAFLLAALFLLFLSLLPLDTAPALWAGPDLLLALALAFSVRRPEYLPALLLVGVMLLADFLLQRPPGLMALLVLIGSETLKAQSTALRDQNFFMEWLSVSGILVAVLLSNRVILAALLLPQAPLGLTLMQSAATICAYPALVGAAHLLVGLRKVTPAEVDGMGRRS
ncbi:MAG TPA: rod shape-determining protein MreD [Rhodobacteraceae bacterium]|jgi:rod shape-determining protein MreD|nr:rod shape-determining protein MreD [Paracoccaceae bacterium]HBV55113.1 rod shape-determining protein MreD [Paracoccaceae bacterium]